MDTTPDDEDLAGWYRREWPDVYRLCFGFLADAAEAEDLAQDAMMHLRDRMPDFDPAGDWRRWRTTVVANLCRDRLRRLDARRRAEDRAAEVRLPPVLPDPATAAENAETREVLRAALAALTPREREVFVLRDLEDLPYSEIAPALDIGESTARTLVALARRRLRGLLGPRLFPDLAAGGSGAAHG